MVWNSPPRCQKEKDQGIMLDPASSEPTFSSPAEIRVREIASRIGLFDDSEILVAVCQQMRTEYVVEEWQLPGLDSRQWEKMNAPIGLAVAVKHVSTQILKERGIQRRHGNRNDRSILEEEKEEEISVTSTCCDRNIFPSPSLSGWSSKKEGGGSESETVEAKTVSNDQTVASKAEQAVVEVEGNSDSMMNTSTAVTSTKEGETKKNNPYEEKPSQSLNSDNDERKTGFIEDSLDWLKLVMEATTNDKVETIVVQDDGSQSPAQRPTSVPKIHKNRDDDTAQEVVVDSKEEQTKKEAALEESGRTITTAFESEVVATPVETKHPDVLKQETPKAPLIVENDSGPPQAEIESRNITKGDDSVNVGKENEPRQVKIDPIDSMEGESSEQTSEGECEKEQSQGKIMSIESIESVESKMEERVLVENKIDNEDCVDETIYVEKSLEKHADDAKEEETPEGKISDSESDVNPPNIFSEIPPSASFSEDEEDKCEENHIENDKVLAGEESSHGPTEVASISILSKEEASLLVLPENFCDDITVAHSNVSQECRKSARNKRMNKRKYPHEYDRGSSSSFEIETASLQKILAELPTDDHQAILSQLLIMTNARDRVSRTNIAFQLQDTLVALIEKHNIDVDPAKAVQIIFHLSRLKKAYRAIFGKSLFKAMSKLYKQSEKLKKKNSPKKEKGKSATIVVMDQESPVEDDDNDTIHNKGEVHRDENGAGD